MAAPQDKPKSVFQSIDWITILIYAALLAFGWMSICGACYEYGQPRDLLSLASFGTRTGMQLVWIGSSIVLGAIILLLDDRIFDTFAYFIYGIFIVLLFITPFLAHDIKGSLSWIKIGPFSFQSAEFAKFATALALAKFMSPYGFKLQGSWKNMSIAIALMMLPMVLIVMQKETGSALVYFSLFLMLYREGMPGFVLFAGISAAAYVVIGLRFDQTLILAQSTSLGEVLVMLMIVAFVAALIIIYCRPSALVGESGVDPRNTRQPYRRALSSTFAVALPLMLAVLALAYIIFPTLAAYHELPSALQPEAVAEAAEAAAEAATSLSAEASQTIAADAGEAAEAATAAGPLFTISHDSFLAPLIDHIRPFNLSPILVAITLLLALRLFWIGFSNQVYRYAYIALFALASMTVFFSANMLVDHLAPHQQKRIQVLLGLQDDPNGVGYNVIQAKIAIGSGGLEGKGFLNGTQTKLKYVPEQETDFIFCTVGEEQGFIGSTAVLVLFLLLMWRLIHVAERQPFAFGRVYGYCVFSVIFFHVLINIGMVLGLMPVIGIPLPFFSYGGSSLWGFTLLLFIFLRIDAGRSRYVRK